MPLPPMATIRQKFPGRRLANIEREVKNQLMRAGIKKRTGAGKKIGITAGSRGIANITTILKATVETLKSIGARPFLIPCMGSHGGGTSEGRLDILDKLGINYANTGAPIITRYREKFLGYISNDLPVYVNEAALECDGILVVNRVKPHTSFHGPLESGLHKMIAVGLGGPHGAAAIHRAGAPALPEIIPLVAREIMKYVPVIMGLAIIENAYEETEWIEAVTPDELEEKECRLLEKARENMPSLPADEIDLLIVDQMGKNFSGTGMDTNIIGRLRIQGLPEPESPRIKRIAVLDLSPETGGNANGIGLADFTTRRLVDKIDFPTTYKNTLTATFTQRAMIPITMENDRQTIRTALESTGLAEIKKARVVRIKNTLHLDKVQVSDSILRDIFPAPNLELIRKPEEMAFDKEGNILPF